VTDAGSYPQAENRDGCPVYDEGSCPFFLSYANTRLPGISPAQRARFGSGVPHRAIGGISYRKDRKRRHSAPLEWCEVVRQRSLSGLQHIDSGQFPRLIPQELVLLVKRRIYTLFQTKLPPLKSEYSLNG
jgi:hypothetical protein